FARLNSPVAGLCPSSERSSPPMVLNLFGGMVCRKCCSNRRLPLLSFAAPSSVPIAIDAMFHAGPEDVGFAVRNALQRRRCASAIRALPSTDLGPVDSPPWKRQRRFPGVTLMMQGAPARVLAQHFGRNLRFKGSPLCDRPRSNILRHQCRSRQVGSEHPRPVLVQCKTVVIETNLYMLMCSKTP